MCNFKVGQTVIRTHGSHMTVKAGDVCKVVGVTDDGSLKLSGHDGSYDNNFFAVYHKKVTLDVCHRLVAYDCEIGSLQSQLDNLHEEYLRQVEQLEDTISTLVGEMSELKSEYSVE